MIKCLFTLLLSIQCCNLIAQLPFNKIPQYINANSNWVMESSFGINFNVSPPSLFSTANDQIYSKIASVSDPATGQLLFYNANDKIWDANHQIMPNGSNILHHSSMKQSVWIFPVTGTIDKYYILSLMPSFYLFPTDNPNYNASDSFAVFYSIVDMSLNDGLGDVVPSQKNIPLTPDGRRYAAALPVPGECGDLWLVLLHHDSAVYEAWHIDVNGIASSPVMSTTNFPHNPIYNVFDDVYYNGGHQSLASTAMRVSSDRRKILVSGFNPYGIYGGGHAHTAIAEFDPNTGIVSNEINIGANSYILDPSLSKAIYASAFSPDNTKLYTVENDIDSGRLCQYDLTYLVKDSIDNSKQTIFTLPIQVGLFSYENLRLYGDTIYMCEFLGQDTDRSIGLVTNPNGSGLSCNYIPNLITLSDSLKFNNFPTEVVYPFTSGDVFNFLTLDTLICGDSESSFFLQATYGSDEFTYEWNTGASSSSIEVVGAGIYWVSYTNGCYTVVDTFRLTSIAMEQPVIVNTNDTLSTTVPFSTYQWLKDAVAVPGATQSTYVAISDGAYQVVVTNAEGCVDTSEVLTIDNDVSIHDMNDPAAQIVLFPNPANEYLQIVSPIPIGASIWTMDGRKVVMHSNTKRIALKGLPGGMYIIRITDGKGAYIKTLKFIKAE